MTNPPRRQLQITHLIFVLYLLVNVTSPFLSFTREKKKSLDTFAIVGSADDADLANGPVVRRLIGQE